MKKLLLLLLSSIFSVTILESQIIRIIFVTYTKNSSGEVKLIPYSHKKVFVELNQPEDLDSVVCDSITNLYQSIYINNALDNILYINRILKNKLVICFLEFIASNKFGLDLSEQNINTLYKDFNEKIGRLIYQELNKIQQATYYHQIKQPKPLYPFWNNGELIYLERRPTTLKVS